MLAEYEMYSPSGTDEARHMSALSLCPSYSIILDDTRKRKGVKLRAFEAEVKRAINPKILTPEPPV